MRCGFFLSCSMTFSLEPRRIGDIESALLVEVGGDRPIHQRRPGDQCDFEARRQRKGVTVQTGFMGRGRLTMG